MSSRSFTTRALSDRSVSAEGGVVNPERFGISDLFCNFFGSQQLFQHLRGGITVGQHGGAYIDSIFFLSVANDLKPAIIVSEFLDKRSLCVLRLGKRNREKPSENLSFLQHAMICVLLVGRRSVIHSGISTGPHHSPGCSIERVVSITFCISWTGQSITNINGA